MSMFTEDAEVSISPRKPPSSGESELFDGILEQKQESSVWLCLHAHVLYYK